jgi:cyclase
VVAIDAKRRQGKDLAQRGEGWDVYTHGGPPEHGPGCGRLGRDRWPEHGAGEILLTSMDRDGTKIGF